MADNIKVGDKVRFLSEEGGGRVSRIEGRIAYVEDADGFEIPTQISEVVRVNDTDDRTMAMGHKEPERKKAERPLPTSGSWRERIKADEETTDPDEEEDNVTIPLLTSKSTPDAPKEPVYEYETDAADDNNPQFLLALTRTDGGRRPTVDLHVVNDSNFFCAYAILQIDSKGVATTLDARTIEPNTKQTLDTYNPVAIDGQTWSVHTIFYKKGVRTFTPIAPTETNIKIKGARILRDTSFVSNDYFDEKAILLSVLRDKLSEQVEKLSEADLHKSQTDRQPSQHKKISRVSNVDTPLEIDLHIDALVENTTGLTNFDMLQLQLTTVRTTMEQNKNRHGQKIVFIHGVGQGVLKNEIRKLLDTSYARCHYQDASFSEYGFGATLVTIA